MSENKKKGLGALPPRNTRRIPGHGVNPVVKYMRNSIDVGGLVVNFQRTCRVPEGRLNSLPAGLGTFPVYKVSDFASGVPEGWNLESHFMPMYAQEAMWMNFSGGEPKALIVGAGNINAITGMPFDKSKIGAGVPTFQATNNPLPTGLDIKLEKEQNYVVVPPQPWLDGWKAEDGKVYQFVAAELGSGETVEGQITGEETAGGIQMIVYGSDKKLIKESTPGTYISSGGLESFGSKGGRLIRACSAKRSVQQMGLGRGGEIDQKIYPDPYGVDVWRSSPDGVGLVYMVSSEDFRQITGHNAPDTPVTYEKYQELGLPWFDVHDSKKGDTPGSDVFKDLKPVGEGNVEGIFDKLDPYKAK